MTARKAAIDKFCRQCIEDPCSPGNWRQQVTLCTALSCPLYDFRPKTTSAIPESVLRWHKSEKGDF